MTIVTLNMYHVRVHCTRYKLQKHHTVLVTKLIKSAESNGSIDSINGVYKQEIFSTVRNSIQIRENILFVRCVGTGGRPFLIQWGRRKKRMACKRNNQYHQEFDSNQREYSVISISWIYPHLSKLQIRSPFRILGGDNDDI